MKKIHFVILAELIIVAGCMFLWCFLRKQTVDNERKCLVQLPQSPLDARRLKPQIVEASAGQHVRADRAENRQTELRLMAEMLYGDFTLENAQKYVEEAERFVLYVFYGVRTETPWTRVEKEAAFLNFVTNMWQLDFSPQPAPSCAAAIAAGVNWRSKPMMFANLLLKTPWRFACDGGVFLVEYSPNFLC